MITINSYDKFYKRYGVITPELLINPIIIDGLELKLPYSSSYHHLHTANTKEFITDITPVIKNSSKVYIKTVTEYTGNIVGSYTRKNSEVKAFVKESRSVSGDLIVLKENHNNVNLRVGDLLVYNYGGLSTFHKYQSNPLSPQHSVLNQLSTLVARINKESVLERELFVNLNIAIPSYERLEEILNKKLTGNMISNFKSLNVIIFIELWKFLNPKTKDESVFAGLKPENYEKVTLLLNSNGILGVLNLGYLFGMVKHKDYEFESDIRVQQIAPSSLRKSLYVFLTKIIHKSITVDSSIHDQTSFDDIDERTTSKPNSIVKSTKSGPDANVKGSSGITNEEIDTEIVKMDEIANDDNDILEILDINGEVSKADIDDAAVSNKPITKAEILAGTNDKTSVVLDRLDNLSNLGLMKAPRYERLKGVVAAQKDIKLNVDGVDIDYNEIMRDINPTLSKDKISVGDSKSVPEKEMLKNVVGEWDRKIIEEQLTPSILKTFFMLQGNNILTNIEVVEKETILGGTNTFVVTYENLDGGKSTVKMIIPKVKSDGIFKMSKNPYYMRKQKSDRPINKISNSRVALTSSYGKIFIDKAIAVRYDIAYWFKKKLNKNYLEEEGVTRFLENYGKGKLTDTSLPRHYLIASKYVNGFNYKDFKFNLNFKARFTIHQDGEDLEEHGGVIIGTKGKDPIFMMPNNVITVYKDKEFKELGTIFELVDLDIAEAPVMFANLKIYSKAVPVGLMLAYYYGLDNLLNIFGVKYELIDIKERVKDKQNKYVTLFADKKLVIEKDYGEGDLVFGGLQTLNNVLKNVHYVNMHKRDSFSGVFAMLDLSIIHVTQIKTLEEFFVDPQTESVLKEMKEPITFNGLLIRSIEILLDDNYKHPNHVEGISVKGHDRIAAMNYREMVDGVVAQRNKSNFGKAKLTVNPFGVIKRINEDSTVVLVDDINPVAANKQTEDVTSLGFGGRSKEAMSKETRPIHQTEIGLFSESNKDSGDVGITAYLTANPRINNTLGLASDYDVSKDNWVNLISTSAMLAPFTINDDVKRAMFSSIQNSHVVPTEHMQTPYVLTGYESVFSSRVLDKYVTSAPSDGIVTNVTPSKVTVDYKPKAVIIKGNPSKEVNAKVTKEFYDAISSILGSKKYLVEFAESNIPLDEIPSAKKGDVYVLFSRGDKYLKDLRSMSKATIIGIGTRSDEGLDLSLRNKDDKTNDKDLGKASLLGHWTLTSAMSRQLKDFVKEGKINTEKYKLYTWFTKEENGTSFPRTIISNVKKGDKVVKDHVICYDKSFFAPDVYDDRKVVYRQGNIITTAFIEDMESFEDSISFENDHASKMVTNVIKTNSTIITTAQTILDVRSIRDNVESTDPLYRISDRDFKNDNLDEKTLEIIQAIKAEAPQSGVQGEIVGIEFLYNCELEDMEDDLRYHVEQSDKRLKVSEGFSGQVDSSYSTNGRPLMANEIEIKIKVRYQDGVGIGDKVIVGNQLKCTTGYVYNKIITGDNRNINAVFSVSGPSNRIVLSTYRIGLLSTHLKTSQAKMLDIYFG